MSYLNRIREGFTNMDRETRLRWGIGVAAVLLLAIILSTLNDRAAQLERKRQRREADLVEMMQLKGRFMEAKALSQRLANRMASTKPDDSPAKLIDEIGIKGKGSRITPMKGEERPGFVEDAAEVKIEGVTANEAVNLLHRLEKGVKPVLVKKALIRARFDDPSRLDLTLTVALLKAVPQGGR